MKGFGGMVSFGLNGGFQAAHSFLKNLKVSSLAASLGGASSLAEHPGTMSHACMPVEIRDQVGIRDGLIRLSVGIENIEDLIDDIARALLCANRGAEAGALAH
jgi:cystathionine beta-lyase/cystathionine gamma-synthase